MGIQKFRSLVNYADIIAGNRGGMASGTDADTFLREEAVPRVFNPPRVGTQGSSLGAIAASTDISAGSDDSLDIAVNGGAVVSVALTLAGLTTGSAIEAELETKINAALLASGQDARVWVNFDGGDDHYEIYSQSTGTAATVVVTDAGANNVADDLKLGVANAGTEAAGVDDQDYLLYTTGGFKQSQPIENDPHRSGRANVGIIKKKIEASFDIDTMLNMDGLAGDSIDLAIRLLNKSTFGTENVVGGQYIQYKQGTPSLFFSAVKVGTIHAEYFTGSYVQSHTMTVPGDAPATMKYTGMAQKGSIAGIGKVNGAVVAGTTITLDPDHAKRYKNEGDNVARLMVVGADGLTITAGQDGSLTFVSSNLPLEQIELSDAVDVEDDGYIVPWHPGAVQKTAKLNVYTDLEGSFKMTPSSSTICTNNIVFNFANNHQDLNNCFGADANQGFAAVQKADATLEVTVDLSNQNLGDLIQARNFGGFEPVIIIGDISSGRYLQLSAEKWIVEVPEIDLPENGTVPVTFTGTFFQKVQGVPSQFVIEYR